MVHHNLRADDRDPMCSGRARWLGGQDVPTEHAAEFNLPGYRRSRTRVGSDFKILTSWLVPVHKFGRGAARRRGGGNAKAISCDGS